MNNKQYAVFEKVPAHGSKPNGVILGSYNTKEEAQSARENMGIIQTIIMLESIIGN
jgi:hypothetical protein